MSRINTQSLTKPQSTLVNLYVNCMVSMLKSLYDLFRSEISMRRSPVTVRLLFCFSFQAE